MTGDQSVHSHYETFSASASEYGVDSRRAPPEAASEAISDLVTDPAIGTPLPGEDVSLPADVTRNPTVLDLERAVTGVTPASLAIAEYGSIVLRADDHGSEPVSLFTDRHVAVLREEDIVRDMSAAFETLGDTLRGSRDSGIIATGPSATADMGSLVQGAHGPKEVAVVVVA
jgi:L-lactate dehydrogenase complex protein LldG